MLQVEAISEDFLALLVKLGEIQTKCRQLLRFHHKTALMELVDETNALQEAAYGRLYRWLQTQFAAMSPESSDLPALIRKGLQALRSRPALFKVARFPPSLIFLLLIACVVHDLDDLVASRRQSLLLT